MHDRLIEEGDASFLLSSEDVEKTSGKREDAAHFADSLPRKRDSRFHAMTKPEIKMKRLSAREVLQHEEAEASARHQRGHRLSGRT